MNAEIPQYRKTDGYRKPYECRENGKHIDPLTKIPSNTQKQIARNAKRNILRLAARRCVNVQEIVLLRLARFEG